MARAEKAACSKEPWWIWKLRSKNSIAAASCITFEKWSSFQRLEAGKEFRESLSACFCWPNSPAQHLSLPAKSNTINEAGERSVVIYRFKMNSAYWLFFPFLSENTIKLVWLRAPLMDCVSNWCPSWAEMNCILLCLFHPSVPFSSSSPHTDSWNPSRLTAQASPLKARVTISTPPPRQRAVVRAMSRCRSFIWHWLLIPFKPHRAAITS